MEINKLDITVEKVQQLEDSGSAPEMLTLLEASQSLPKLNNRRISVTTLWRWARQGYHGVFLEYSRMGRRIVVTPESLKRFFSEVAKLDAETHGPTNFKRKRRRRRYQSDASRQRELDDARAVLVRAKILQEAPQS